MVDGSRPPSAAAGSGRIVLNSHGQKAVFSELSYTYPLKLLSPQTDQDGVAIAYVLSYGGGLVGGDRVHLNVHVASAARLILLTQGSTKVFKTRPGRQAAVSTASLVHDQVGRVVQKLDVSVEDSGALFLLPDPVTCFRSASYDQIQIFRLQGNASAVILDWVTSGRMSRGEEWEFSRYHSVNEVWIDGKRIARDAMLLEDDSMNIPALSTRTLKARLAPYSCYATVLLFGSIVQNIVDDICLQYEKISVYQQSSPPDFIWSISRHPERAGCVMRVAGLETDAVRDWLRTTLVGLQDAVGVDVYSKAFV